MRVQPPKIDETAPAPATPTNRLARFQHEHPALYASRHVVLATLKVLLPLLGLGALVAALLPQIGWPWLEELGSLVRSLLQQLDRPPANRPEWIVWLIGSPVFVWAKWLFRWAKWLLPIIIAVVIAAEEFQRHQRQTRAQNSAAEPVPSSQSDGQDSQASKQ